MRTRIDFELAKRNNAFLGAMNERTQLQLRLQQTVEGLSIAAISYYIVGLVGYLFKGTKDAGFLGISVEVATACAVPVVLVLMALINQRLRARLFGR